jgi:hypothetical protein
MCMEIKTLSHICINSCFDTTIKSSKIYLQHFITIEMSQLITMEKIITYSYYVTLTEYQLRIIKHRDYINVSIKLFSSYKSIAFLQASNQCVSFDNLYVQQTLCIPLHTKCF